MVDKQEIDTIRNLPFFFILGRPRSGTTLLRTILDAHPNIIIPPENSNLIHLYYKHRHTGFKREAGKVDELMTDFTEGRAVKAFWRADYTKARKMILSCREENITFSEIIKIIHYNYQSFSPKEEIKIIGDKSPVNSLYANELRLIFPNARFIHLFRDYRGNLSSMSKHDIFPARNSTILLLWKKSVNQIETLARQYPSQYFSIRYEDFVTEPEKHIKGICEFLNVPYLTSILDTKGRKTGIEQAYSTEFIAEWQPDLMKEISTGNIYKWKEKLSRKAILQADYLVGETGERLGYEKMNNYFSTIFKLKSFIQIAIFEFGEMQRHIFDRLPYSWKGKIMNRKFILSKEIFLLCKRIVRNE
jgi:hypothetical protein